MRCALNMIYLVLGFLTAGASAAEVCPALPASAGYQMRQVYWSSWVSTDFKLSTQDGRPAGKIVEKLIHLPHRPVFRLKNERGELVAFARERLTSLVTKINIYDCHGVFLGGLRKSIVRSMVQGEAANTFKVIDAAKHTLSQSRKTEAANTEITFYDAQNSRIVAQARRPQINVAVDTWDVQIYADQQTFDPRLLLFAPVFKTANDR